MWIENGCVSFAFKYIYMSELRWFNAFAPIAMSLARSHLPGKNKSSFFYFIVC